MKNKKNYKNTLNLPQTLFPMKANLKNNEINILKKWEKQNLYKLIRENKKDKNIFLLHDGPPYANGDIHIGHTVNKILKDIIIKSKGLMGMNSPYIMGWDCHGLPIEAKINKNKCFSENIRIECRKYALSQINNQKNDFIRLGILSDYNNYYSTMNYITEANIIRILGKLIDLKYIKSGNIPIYWCIDCNSNLSESEINYNDNHLSISMYIKFYIKNYEIINKIFNINKLNYINFYIVIWTTTPWSIIDNKAVAINPDVMYSLINTEYGNLIISKDLIKDFNTKTNIKIFNEINSIKGILLKDLILINPIDNNILSPIIFNKNIESNFGTGIVHIAPGHGQLDYEIGIKFKLKIENSIDKNGKYFNTKYKLLNDEFVFNSIDKIINLLKINKTYICSYKFTHSYPYCYRHNIPIIFRVINQWFIDLNKNNLRERALLELKNVKFIPINGKEQFINMLIKRPNWCISRQRNWGIPITIFVNKKTNKIHPNMVFLINKISKLVEKYGIEYWWKLDLIEILGNEHKKYKKVYDVLDVWFDSGTTFLSVIKEENIFKNKSYADLYIEGSDQYRGWFMSSLLISVALYNKAPYRRIISHGFVVDLDGKKMSKSIGNVIKPKTLLKNFGSDIIRLWVASEDYKKNLTISNEILERISDIYRRIRNTIRFLLSNLYDFNPDKDIVKFEEMLKIDQWVINHTYNFQKKIIYFYNSYKFHYIIEHLMKFCSIDMGSNYLEIIKDRQYVLKSKSHSRKSCQTAIYHILESLVRLISPILSFTSDEIWNFIPGNRSISVFIEEWYLNLNKFKKNELINDKIWNLIFLIKYEINKDIEKLKTNKEINSSLELHLFLYFNNIDLINKFKILNNELHNIFLTSIVTINYINKIPLNVDFNSNIKNIKITLNKINGIKCNRCWNYFYNYKNNKLDICKRCLIIIN